MGSACCNNRTTTQQTELLNQAILIPAATPSVIHLLEIAVSLPACEENSKKDLLDEISAESPCDRKSCIRHLRNTAFQLLNRGTFVSDELEILKLYIETIGELVHVVPLHSITAIYELATLAVNKSHFSPLYASFHKALFQCNTCRFDTVSIVTESYQSDLMNYCRGNALSVTEKDIELMRLLLPGYVRSGLSTEAKQTKWNYLFDFVLERLEIDVCGNNEILIGEEKRLMEDLCDLAMENEQFTHKITLKVLRWIDSTSLWGRFAESTLGIIVSTVVHKKPHFSVQLLKTMLNFTASMLGKEDIMSRHYTILTFVTDFMRISKVNISTSSLTDVTFTQTLQGVILPLLIRNGLENSGIAMLRAWCQCADFQSCIQFLTNLFTKTHNKLSCFHCINILRKSIKHRVLKDWYDPGYTSHWNSLLTTIMCTVDFHSLISFQLTSFLLQITHKNTHISAIYFHHFTESILTHLGKHTSICEEFLQLCKYAYQIWCSVCVLQSLFLRPVLVIAAGKLQEMMEGVESPALRAVLAVLFVALIRYIGVNYQVEVMLEYVEKLSGELENTHICEELYLLRDWENVDSGATSLFNTQEIHRFQSISVLISLPKIDLMSVFQQTSPHRSSTQLCSGDTKPDNPDSFRISSIHTTDFTPTLHHNESSRPGLQPANDLKEGWSP